MDHKLASPDHPVHELISRRWSPYSFDARPVSRADLLSLFEAARWAASSYNEQPWGYIVATREDGAEFDRLLSCLVETNQLWAKAAPALAIGVARLNFSRNNKPNGAAVHDLGQASANLTTEATARGLAVHQMIGILPDRARELYDIPPDAVAVTGLAIGYIGDSRTLSDSLAQRDLAPRRRRPLNEFVFTGRWGNPSPLIGGERS